MLTKAKGLPDLLDNAVSEQDQTHYWGAQYDFEFLKCMPSANDVWFGEVDKTLAMPGAMPRKSGRPGIQKRILSPMERRRAKAQRTLAEGADTKPRKTYKCKKCGQPKKGHTCQF